MKPVTLILEGLQSYREKQTVNFRLMHHCGLFGIFGPTGSGKSTILDAMTLALFGTVSRASHNTQGIINSACDTVSVSLTFELSLSGKRQTYRIDRVYRRKPKMPDSCEPRISRLMLLEQEESSAGTILADKPTEVNAAVEKLLGLHYDDFTRAVVLPQNQFQEFLLLGKKEKSDMLERLFCLEEYGQELSRKIARSRRQAEDEIRQAAGALDVLQDCTDAAVLAMQQAAENCRLTRLTSATRLESIRQQYHSGRELIQLVRQKLMLLDSQTLQDNQTAAIEADRLRLDRAKAAEPIRQLVLDRQALATEIEGLRTRQTQISLDLDELSGYLKNNRLALATDQAEGGPLKAEMDEQIRKLSVAAGLASQAGNLAGRIKQISLDRQSNQTREQADQQHILQIKTQLDAALQTVQALQQSRQNSLVDPAWRLELEKWLQSCQQRTRLRQSQAESEKVGQNLVQQLAAYQDQYHKAGLSVSNEQAVMILDLSSQLQAGEPCPVCGSTDHPQRAHLRDQLETAKSGSPGRAQIQRLLIQTEERIDANHKQLTQIKQEQEALTSLTIAATARCPRLTMVADPENELNRLYQQETQWADINQQLQQTEKAVELLQTDLRQLDERRHQLAGLITGQDQLLQELENQNQKSEHALKALLPDWPVDQLQPLLLSQKLERLQKERQAMDLATENLQKENRRLEADYQPLDRQILETRTKLEVLSGHLKQIDQQLAGDLEKAGFTDETELIANWLDPETVQTLTGHLRQYDDEKRDLELQLRQCDSQLQNRWLDETAWQDLERNWQMATAEYEQSVRDEDLTGHRLTEILSRQTLRRQKEADCETATARRDRIGQIDALVRGNAFVEYVAEERLRAIVAEATEYLQTMTRYRFALELDQDLSFVIRDQMNGGEIRLASSLSGGETFMASLALALALSSQIQIRGQSRLEFFFLDEGFGSLDGDLLDQVMDSLERISSPQRMIGLISHVPELRNRIGTRLMITAANGHTGSRIELEHG